MDMLAAMDDEEQDNDLDMDAVGDDDMILAGAAEHPEYDEATR